MDVHFFIPIAEPETKYLKFFWVFVGCVNALRDDFYRVEIVIHIFTFLTILKIFCSRFGDYLLGIYISGLIGGW